MGRIKKWLEWIGAGIVAVLAIIGFGTAQLKRGEADGEIEGRAEADREGVQRERERVAGESTADLYKDLTK